MDLDVFAAVDRYIDQLFVPRDAALEAAVQTSRAAGIPQIQITPSQGKFLYMLARIRGARRILEIGTLAGYSTIWLGRALPADGRLLSLELDADYAEVAKRNILRAGLAERVEVRVGPALETLSRLVAAGEPPYDMAFIDAQKKGYPEYLSWVLRLSKPGTVIVADNVVREGKVLDAESTDKKVKAARAFNAMLAAEPRVESLVVQQVGAKGHDGVAIAIVK
jgi:predicted O-methyltransferase YrrM